MPAEVSASPPLDAPRSGGPPRWLILSTAALALACLFMAVAETTLWTHYLVDRGEYLSLVGLTFILVAGLYLRARRRLLSSLPLAVPWLLYPVVTQADQIIDNLAINQMRVVTHLILALLFATPIVVLVMAARHALVPAQEATPRHRVWTRLLPGLRLIEQGRTREGSALVAMTFLLLEIWIAYIYLGTLMVLILVGSGLFLLYYYYASAAVSRPPGLREPGAAVGERRALWVLVVGVLVSLGLFLGYKNRPGAYQGSPHYYFDPARQDAAYPMDHVEVPDAWPTAPAAEVARAVESILADYGQVLQALVGAYYVLDRNYNYAFHNALFLRHTPVLPGFRATALEEVARIRPVARAADARLANIRVQLPLETSLVAFLDDVSGYVAFNLRRAATLERMSAEFEQTQAGLQHATHLYEGEGKVLGEVLMDILEKHRAVTSNAELAALVDPFIATSRGIFDAYSNRIIGF